MKAPTRLPARQRGGFVIGLVVGLLVGLAISLGVALYVTKVPVPFVTKVPARPAGQDAAEAERNRTWDPNGGLAGKNPAPSSASEPVARVPAPVTAPGTSPMPAPALANSPPTAAAAASAVAAALPSRAASSTRAAAPSPASLFGSGSDPFLYFVQAGAYARTEDAEQQRAKLAMLGLESRLTEREQAGRTVYRVRVGPFDRKQDADAAKDKLSGSGVDAALVRVQK